MVDLERLQELKKLLVETDDFSVPWNFFFDHFGEDPHFMSLGKKAKSATLTAVVKAIAKELYGDDAKPGKPRLIYLRQHKFVHGSCMCDGRLMVVIFFSDIDMGMISATRSPAPGDGALLVRFSSQQFEAGDGKTVLMGSPGQKKVH